jgi:hypothetical protein
VVVVLVAIPLREPAAQVVEVLVQIQAVGMQPMELPTPEVAVVVPVVLAETQVQVVPV